ncbi:MAG TPA: aldolase [Deltaproteobacteria bacterium]|nr:MAG: aldolase [bacterium]HDH10499.1 aldolase [Deltaproteobacteria bacterium]
MERQFIPADVPFKKRVKFIENYTLITQDSERMMLFAGDQKVEHLNKDFYGENISKDDADPEHLFKIAKGSKIGVFATQFGLISKYGLDYPEIPYLVKLNSKTNLVKTEQADPFSNQWLTVDKVARFKKQSLLKIAAVGYTIYIGSEFEYKMLKQAANIVNEAHQNGLVAILWIYPRGKAVKDEKDPHLIAGATGIAACLGADFVKVNYPEKKGKESKEIFKEAVISAGKTKVVCAGGSSADPREFFQRLHDQIFISGASGNATGRNIHQKDLATAIKMCNAISAITFDSKSVDEAMNIYQS